MTRDSKAFIPTNTWNTMFNTGILVSQPSSYELELFEMAKKAHRDDYHSFCFLEKGTAAVEVDFQIYQIAGPAALYIRPNQVHRAVNLDNVAITFLIINSENLRPEYVKILQEVYPSGPIRLDEEASSTLSQAIATCVRLSECKNELLYHSILRDSSSAVIALIASRYMAQAKPIEALSRFEEITRTFKSLLEGGFITLKRPSDYAAMLHISTIYLNECVKKATGYSVSHHILGRIMLEAKRMLCYSGKSVKEIALELGYDDYPYFSRLFTKATGMTALAFRAKNHD